LEALLPEVISPAAALFLITFAFFTSALTATAGIGGGLLMLGVMSYLLPITALIPIHAVVQFGSNASRTFIQRENINWRIALFFILGAILGIILGAMVIIQLPEKLLFGLIGIFILLMTWVRLPSLKSVNSVIIIFGGAITTFISVFAGATGPLVAVFLNNVFENHKNMAATVGITMTAQHSLKILAFGILGFAFVQWLPLIAAMICMGFLGAKAGTALMYKLPEKALKASFKIVITMIALDMLRRAVF